VTVKGLMDGLLRVSVLIVNESRRFIRRHAVY